MTMTMTPEQISDQLSLQRLTHLYCDAIDRGNFDALDMVFTPDAEIDYTAMGGIKACYPQIKIWLSETLPTFGNAHHIVANHLFEIDGDAATGRITCFNPMGWPRAMPDQDGKSVMFFSLWYCDRYIRTADGWRISYRTEEPWIAYNVPSGVMPE